MCLYVANVKLLAFAWLIFRLVLYKYEQCAYEVVCLLLRFY